MFHTCKSTPSSQPPSEIAEIIPISKWEGRKWNKTEHSVSIIQEANAFPAWNLSHTPCLSVYTLLMINVIGRKEEGGNRVPEQEFDWPFCHFIFNHLFFLDVWLSEEVFSFSLCLAIHFQYQWKAEIMLSALVLFTWNNNSLVLFHIVIHVPTINSSDEEHSHGLLSHFICVTYKQ